MGVEEKDFRSLFYKSIRFTVWCQTYLAQYIISNCGHWPTSMLFKGTVTVIFLVAHHPRIQKPVVKGLRQPKVTSKPFNLITMKNHQANPSLFYLVLF